MRAAIAELDDEQFARRQQALAQLARWSRDTGKAPLLARQCAEVLARPQTTFQVRSELEALARQLPEMPQATPPWKFEPADIPVVVDQLGADSWSAHDLAGRQLRAMMTQEKLLPPLFVELKRRATAANLTTEGRRTLEPLLHEAREAWLQSDPAKVPLPIPSARQMGQWIEDLTVLDDAEAAGRFRREMAERELLDLIARDDTRDEALKLLKAKIDTSPDAATSTTLRTIADFARPAMAAEVWKDRENIFVQYLIIGEPQFNEGTTNPTHFDRIDENLAHCVTGNSLTEGDYPVRIAIGYPDHPGKDRMFYLTNLPTARRRLLYEYQVKRDEAVRLREISERTVDHFLANKLVLDQTQVLVLAQLDPRIASKFAGKYLDTMPNARLLATAAELNEQSTVHAGICYVMTRMGTREALPAVERVARSGRLGKPRFESPIQMAWIAALSIAQRDPWPEVDQWLAALLDDTTPLVTSIDPPPQLGPTAAAVLLDHRGASMRPFGLDAAEVIIGQCRFISYRYESDKDREDIQRWWKKESSEAAANPTP